MGDGTIADAEPGGAARVKLHYNASYTHYVSCPEQYRTAMVAAAEKYIGVPYSFLDYAALATHRLHLPAPFLRRYIASSKHMICSQLVDQAASDAGWVLFSDGRWSGYCTPGDIWEAHK